MQTNAHWNVCLHTLCPYRVLDHQQRNVVNIRLRRRMHNAQRLTAADDPVV